MNNWLHLRRFLLLAAIALMTAALGACSSENEPAPSDSDAEGIAGRLALRISMGDVADADGSRAAYTPSDGTYDPGSGYENYIDLESAAPDYRIYVFDADGDRFLFSPDTVEVVRIEANYPSCRDYELYFHLSADRCTLLRNCTKGFKIAMLTNWRGAYPVLTPGQSTVASIASSAEAVMEWTPRGAIATAADRIPMFGIRHIIEADFSHPGETTWVGTLYLLRSIAKVEVIDANLIDGSGVGPYITNVELVRYNTRTAMAPAGVNHQNQYVTGSWFSDYLESATVPENSEVADAMALTQVEDEEGHWLIYCPEYSNLIPDGTRARPGNSRTALRVTYSDDVSKIYTVEFKDYTSTASNPHFNVHRNTWYQFEISRGSAYLNCVVNVLPYAIVDLKPEFGIGADEQMIPIINESTGLVEYYYDPETGKYWDVHFTTEIENPYLAYDPVSKRSIIYNSETGEVLYYYDRTEGLYYASDNITVIPNPYLQSDIDEDYRIGRDIRGYISYYYKVSTAQYVAPDKVNRVPSPSLRPDVVDSSLRVAVNADNEVRFYYNIFTGCYYDTNRQLRPNPYLPVSPGNGLQSVPNADGTTAVYYDYSAGRYLATDMTTVVPNPFASIDTATGLRYCRTKSGIYFYYDPATGKYFDEDKDPIDYNPLLY